MTKLITSGRLHTIDGSTAWGRRKLERFNRRKQHLLSKQSDKVMNLFIFSIPTTIYTSWANIDNPKSMDALDIPNNLIAGYYEDIGWL